MSGLFWHYFAQNVDHFAEEQAISWLKEDTGCMSVSVWVDKLDFCERNKKIVSKGEWLHAILHPAQGNMIRSVC